MKVIDLWVLTTYCGEIQFEDENHGVMHPIIRVKTTDMVDILLNKENPHNYLTNREVKYFDFFDNAMRIVLKGE